MTDVPALSPLRSPSFRPGKDVGQPLETENASINPTAAVTHGTHQVLRPVGCRGTYRGTLGVLDAGMGAIGAIPS